MGKNTSTYRRSRQRWKYPGKDWHDEYHDYHGLSHWHGSGYRHRSSEINIHEAVNPLKQQIKIYDEVRQKIEKRGGTPKDYASISNILSKEICLETYYGQAKVTLTNPSKVRSALYDIDYGLHLQIRNIHSGMHCYYLCRNIDINLSDYNSIVVEDLYISPEYPLHDKRFVGLMKAGKERSFLRLSPFRANIKKGIQDMKNQNLSIEYETDKILYNIGRNVIGPAWHEDQFPGMQAADHFELRRFPQVIELLYLDLSGELCELRSQIDMEMLNFFQTTYFQPAILDFLKKLKDLNGAELNELTKEGLSNYVSLQKAFSNFLSIEIAWGKRKMKMPLNTLLLGNFSRLNLVGKALNQSKDTSKARKRLEKEVGKIISIITEKKRNEGELLLAG